MSNTPTPLSREELKNTVLHEMAHLIAEYAQLTADDIMVLVDSFLKAFADEVEREVIGQDDKHLDTKFSRCEYFDHLEDDECTCGAVEQNYLRESQRQSLKDLLEKWGIK